MIAGRPEPYPDRVAEPFWQAARNDVLAIQRCRVCLRYQHPPEAFCTTCQSEDVEFTPVTGRGHVYSYTETHSGARHPAFAEATPYLVGLVVLAEQDDLFFYTNFPGARLADLKAGAEVEVVFEKISDDFKIPQFWLV